MLLEFAAAMAKWETEGWKEQQRDISKWTEQQYRDLVARQTASCKAIIERYCTDKPRAYSRPNAMHFSNPSEYLFNEKDIESAAQDTKRRILIDVKHSALSRHRFVMVKRADRWLVDGRQAWLGGDWMSAGL